MFEFNPAFAERIGAERDSRRDTSSAKQFQEGEVAELVLSGQRQSLRQDVLR